MPSLMKWIFSAFFFLTLGFLGVGYIAYQLSSTPEKAIPTLFPIDDLYFDPEQDAQELQDALIKLPETNGQAIIDVFYTRATFQRVNTSFSYKQNYRRSLVKDFKMHLTGQFQNLSVMLTAPTHEFLARELQYSMVANKGPDTKALTELLMSRSNQELADAREFYAECFGVSLISEMQSKIPAGSEQDLLILLAEGIRDESSYLDRNLVSQDVDVLYEAGTISKHNATNETAFVEIFATRSWLHLDAVSNLYVMRYEYPLELVIRENLQYSAYDSMMNVYEYSRNKKSYFATRLFNAMKAPLTKHHDIMRIIVSRCEIDLKNIKDFYHLCFAEPLSTAIASKTTGDYRTGLLKLLDETEAQQSF